VSLVLGPGESILGPVPGPEKCFAELSLPEGKSFLGMSSPKS
jgi:hypothetical protein